MEENHHGFCVERDSRCVRGAGCEAGFVAWFYASYDSLEEILQPGYFNGFSRSPIRGLPAVGLLEAIMVRGRDEQGIMRMRLVHDYGRPEDPDAPMMQPPKPRGRPRARPE